MKEILSHLFSYKRFTRTEARTILLDLARGTYNNAQMAAFLTAYAMRGITVEELAGFREAMLDLCDRVDLSAYEAIDLCGTGGDGKNTFNISTLASFVLAGAGYKVAKHGNYAVSSMSGSSNILEFFGYQFSSVPEKIIRSLDEAGICFLHAPLFHPAMKTLAPIRQALGVKTFLNMLGPLVNPAQPHYQMVGVFDLSLARLYNQLYQPTDKRYMIVHSLDGYDEVSLTSSTKVYSPQGEYLLDYHPFTPNALRPEDLLGGEDLQTAAHIFYRVLDGEGTVAQNQVVLANAALAIQCLKVDKSLEDCLQEASDSLMSGRAKQSFNQLITLK